MEICRTNFGRKIPQSFLYSTKRITKSNIRTVVGDGYKVYLVMSKDEKLFLHNPMMYMSLMGRRITEEFNILAFNTLLVLEFYPDEYLLEQGGIAQALNALYDFIDETVVDYREVDNTDMIVMRLEIEKINDDVRFVVDRMLKNIGIFKKEY